MKSEMVWKDILFNPGAHCPGSSLGLLVLRFTTAWQGVGIAPKLDDLPLVLGVQGFLYALGLGTRLLPFLLVALWWSPSGSGFPSWPMVAVQVALSLTGAGAFSLDAKMTRARGYLPCAGSD